MMSRDDPPRRSFERYTGPPMTLRNMRENGIRTLDAWCLGRDCLWRRSSAPMPRR